MPFIRVLREIKIVNGVIYWFSDKAIPFIFIYALCKYTPSKLVGSLTSG